MADSMYKLVKLFNVCRLLPLFFRNGRNIGPRPVHIIFCTVDHFEPGTGGVGLEEEMGRMRRLLERYPKLADGHRDYHGNVPKRTWFFPPHYHRNDNLRKLVSLCEAGYGEIELHLHHGKTRPDTPENLKSTIEHAIGEYAQFGIFGEEDGRKRYGFIHGNNALDNSRKGRFCGVDSEIQILRETGCYADFTFPCFNEANPFQINSIFYSNDVPEKPKSYNRGVPVERNRKPNGDLMIIQGPIYPYLIRRSLTGLRLYGAAIDGRPPVTERRIDSWINTGIHVKGFPNWVFVKADTHGCIYEEAVLGKEMDDIFSYLGLRYNDGEKYALHYVTARELYNIVKAVEGGGPLTDPEDYRDYAVKRPMYDASPAIPSASDQLRKLIENAYA